MKVDCFQEENKYCVLCIDEMSIKANLFYNRVTDSIIGLEQNEQNVKVFKPALHVCVLMLRGIYLKWKQPLAYYLCHSSCSSQSLKNILSEAVLQLNSVRLKVCAVTSDMGSNNLQLSRILNVNVHSPHFTINNQKNFYIFDIPHIIKAIRNMLLKYDFIVDNNTISWKY